MSDYHILITNEKDSQARVIYHIPVPNGSGITGLPYSSSIKESIESGVGFVQTASSIHNLLSISEIDSLNRGSIVEVDKTISFNADWPNSAKRQVIEDIFNQLTASISNQIITRLDFWNLTGNV